MTLAQVLELYKRHRTPRKTEAEQKQDGRRAEMWERVLGADQNPNKIALREWERFIDLRSSGAIDARGKPVPEEKKRRPVRARTVEADCDWLRWVFNWAVKWRTSLEFYLMKENPVRGFEAPTEKNPRRPVATEDRYEAIRKVSDRVTMEVRWNGKTREQRSYLSELLEIVNGTGRRISAVCSLRYRNLRLAEGPYGAIHWPADTDKTGRESVVPIGPDVRAAIDRVLRERPGIGEAPLFPAPESPSKPIRYELASDCLREAEELAEVEPHDGRLWHAYRRKWATERKHLPVQDVAVAGG